jgi:hypothetical protein
MQAFNSAVANMRTLFDLDIDPAVIPNGHILMNAPRPLLGVQAPINHFAHGRYWVLLDEADAYSAKFAEKNAELDAYIVLPATQALIMEMILSGCKYSKSYRSMAFEDRWNSLSGRINSIQRLPYYEALSKSQRAAAKLKGPSVDIHAILAIDHEQRFERRVPDYKLANAMVGRTVAYDRVDPDVPPRLYEHADEHPNLDAGDAYGVVFELVYDNGGDQLSLGFHHIIENAERAQALFANRSLT